MGNCSGSNYSDISDSSDDSSSSSSDSSSEECNWLGTCCSCVLFMIVISFYVGFVIGYYSRPSDGENATVPDGRNFTMILNNKWFSENSTSFLKLPARRIFIADTNASKCLIQDNNNCSQFLDNYKSVHNFLIDEDGAVVEGLGWHYPCRQSPNCDASSISIAFMGEFVGDTCPAINALQSLINFIDSSQTNSKIFKCFMTTLNFENILNLCFVRVASTAQELTRKYGC